MGGVQAWSNGRCAVMGISYFAMNAWRVAATQPPHLAAIVPWEGAVDTYRDAGRHGGIYSNNFNQRWSTSVRRHATGEDRTAASEPRAPPPNSSARNATTSPTRHAFRFLCSRPATGAGLGLHLRGNVEGYLGAGSEHKFLEIHSGNHVVPSYSVEGRLFQKRFLDQRLLDIDTGITRKPPVKLAIRRGGEEFVWRYENEWPIARTQWTKYYLDAASGGLSIEPPATSAQASCSAEHEAPAAGSRATFSLAPFEAETEITGPLKLALWVSTTADDADLFAIVRNSTHPRTRFASPAS